MRTTLICILFLTFALPLLGQKPKAYGGMLLTFAPINSDKGRSPNFSNDSVSVVTIDSLRVKNTGFEMFLCIKRLSFVFGVSPNATLIGDREFRLNYNSIGSNSIVQTKLYTGHFMSTSRLYGLGYSFGKRKRHVEFSTLFTILDKTGRFIIHDDIYNVYSEQQKLSSEVQSSLADSIRIDIDELNQSKSRNIYLGLRPQLSYSSLDKNNSFGVLATVAIHLNYLAFYRKNQVFTSIEETGNGSFSFGIVVGVGFSFETSFKAKAKISSSSTKRTY